MINTIHSNFIKLLTYPKKLQIMSRRLSKCEMELDIINQLIFNQDYSFSDIKFEYQTDLVCEIRDLVENKDSVI